VGGLAATWHATTFADTDYTVAVAEGRPVRGLDRTEKILFAIGIFAFAMFMLLFGDGGELPLVVLWIVTGFGFIWWFDRHLKSR
jgi:hypothetical protein